MSFGWNSTNATFLVANLLGIGGIIFLSVDWTVGYIKHRRDWKKDPLSVISVRSFLIFLIFEVVSMAYSWRTHALENQVATGDEITIGKQQQQIQNLQFPKPLTDTQEAELVELIKRFPGQKVTVEYYAGNRPCEVWATRAVDIFRANGWVCPDVIGVLQFNRSPSGEFPSGIEIVMNKPDAIQGKYPAVDLPMAALMDKFGLTKQVGMHFVNDEIKSGEIQVRVCPLD
jgi:hypothetical protein